jgi:hypothetical protein
MNNYIDGDIKNFYNLRFLDEYMIGHKGFILGGCFKNIFNKEKIKDVDIFFKNSIDRNSAIEYYDNNSLYHFFYENKKVKAYKNTNTNIVIELISHTYGTPEEIMDKFDFTITKFAYYKDYSINELTKQEEIEYKIKYHNMFFEHLHMKRLVADDKLLYPVSSFERSYKYAKYGYLPCKETKLKLIDAIKKTNDLNLFDSLSNSLYDGID